MCSESGAVGLSQDEHGVTGTIRDPASDTFLRVRCKYLLGCDGGRSAVREFLGVTMSGRSHSEVGLVADTLGDPHTERYGMHHGDPERPYVIIPVLSVAINALRPLMPQ